MATEPGLKSSTMVGRCTPWWRITGRYGANLASSRSQFPTTDVGQTTRCGWSPSRPASSEIVCNVLPRPMSSASNAPNPSSLMDCSHATLVVTQGGLDVFEVRLPIPACGPQPVDQLTQRFLDNYLDRPELLRLVLAGQGNRQCLDAGERHGLVHKLGQLGQVLGVHSD